ncbi:MAG TPA: glycosyltransferase family 4 protein [Caldilineae bacterium]|nr:glycosyltransferase family 4 protein [Caldilineae bacterium]
MVPQVSGVGGMVSFRAKFTAGLQARGIEVTPDPKLSTPDALLVIGGTRDLPGLWRARRRGLRIVQRLNGMNWLHRLQRTGSKHYLRAEYGNWILNTIRTRLADHIVYQSEFSRRWWQRVYGPAPVPNSVVYNAVDLAVYRPQSGSPKVPPSAYRVLLVEGSLLGGYELGLETAVRLVERLNTVHRAELAASIAPSAAKAGAHPVELVVAGRVSEAVQARWARQSDTPIRWMGLVPADEIPALDRSAHLLYSSDINAACPNSVIEALACGLPVLAFDTGALPELVSGEAGRVVPYGGDPWKLEPPDIPALAEAALEILADQPRFRTAARARAESAFGLDAMLDGYLQALEV